MSFVITTDTSANLPTDVAKKLELTVIPFSYYIGGEENICLDTSKYDADDYFKQLGEGLHVTTSQITPQRYIEYLTPLLEAGKDILHISMSSGISGACNSAYIAAKQLKESFPDRKIEVIDSHAASLGEGLVVCEAVKIKRTGKSLEETAEAVRDVCRRVYQVFTVDDLMYLKRGGRLSAISAGIGSVLGIKPILKGNTEGKIVAFAKVRGRSKAIASLAERYEKLVENQPIQTVYIAHCGCKGDAKALAELINKNKPPKKIFITDYEPVTGSYLGPGALALFFMSHYDCQNE